MTARPSRQAVLDAVPLSERADVLLDRALELGALPAATQQLLALTRSDDAEVGPVVDALGRDASLTAAVLRAANSPAYGQSRSIGDLRRAVVVIGMQELHDLVAGTSMLATFSRPDPLSQRLQSTAVLSATIAQKLASRLGVGPASAAYLSGLMCELGALACLALDPSYSELFRASEGEARQRFESEAARYGAPTPEIGGRILAASALPADVVTAVASTGLEPRKAEPELGRAVAFARLAAGALLAASEHGEPEVLRSDLGVVAVTLALDDVPTEQLLDLCLAAATSCQLSLRGALGIRQSQPENDVAPIARPRQAEPAAAKPRTGLYLALGLAALAAGVLAWLLTK